MQFNGFSVIGDSFEAAVTVINKVSSVLCTVLATPMTLAITIWILAYAYATMRGETHQPISNFIGKYYKIAWFVVCGLSVGVFQNLIVPAVMDFQTGLGQAVAGSISNTGLAACNGSGPYQLLDCYCGASLGLVAAYFIQAMDSFPQIGTALVYVASGILLAIGLAIYGIIMMFELLEARLMLFLLLALGPLFIVAGAFSKTETFFNNWIAQIANLAVHNALIAVYIYMSLTIFMSNFGNVLMSVTDDGGQGLKTIEEVFGSQPFNMIGLALQMVLEILVLAFLGMKVPRLAQALTGGGFAGSGMGAFVGGAAGAVTGQAIPKAVAALTKAIGSKGGSGGGSMSNNSGGASVSSPGGSNAAHRASERANARRNNG